MSADGSLVGLNLDGYVVDEVTEIYRTDMDGRRAGTIGIFRDPQVAAAWAAGQSSPEFTGYKTVLVASNGERHFCFSGEEVELHDDEEARLDVRSKALAKLSPEERAVLGL